MAMGLSFHLEIPLSHLTYSIYLNYMITPALDNLFVTRISV